MEFYCSKCRKKYPIDGLTYMCQCGGLFNLLKRKDERVDLTISLGEVETPIISRKIEGIELHVKVDYLLPTGSFKDRGAITLVNTIAKKGIKRVVEDSSGNAGASIAAYCAAAGIQCDIYLPEDTSAGKIKQINAYGAKIVKVPGSRDATSEEISKAAKNIYYASHVYNPLFYEGIKSIAYEIHNQIGIPDYIVIPIGNGSLLLGVYLGFLEIGQLPRIVGVQSENCSPVYNKYKGIKATNAKRTVAEGIAVGKPARIDDIIKAIKHSGGDIIVVSDEKIAKMGRMLGTMGIYTEITSAVAVAGAVKYFSGKKHNGLKILVPLTGSGLKK